MSGYRNQTGSRPRKGEAITAAQLLHLSLDPMITWIKHQMLHAELRKLEMHADYFSWQEANGREGLADTHKRIAMVKSDLLGLQ